jgi:hypothetical protein
MPEDTGDEGPFIARSDRPTPIDLDKPLSELRLRDLLAIVDAQVSEAATRAAPRLEAGVLVDPERFKPEELKPERVKPEQLKPEQLKPEQFKPEDVKPERVKPELFKPEDVKPEQFKPETLKPELSKPEKPFLPGGKLRDLVGGLERELLAGIEVLEAERARRMIERSPVVAVSYQPDDPVDGLGLLLPGTVTLFVASPGSSLLEEVAEVFGDGTPERVRRLIDTIAVDAAQRGRMDPLETARNLAASRAFASFRYAGKVLAENLGLPAGLDFGVISFPYAGLELDPADFVLEQYVKHEFQERLDAVVVIRPPVLSDAERAALELVPPEQREIGIGTPGHVAVTVTTVTVALFVVAVHTPTLTGGHSIDQLRSRVDKVYLGAERLAKLRSPATVPELVALRRELQAELF